MSELCRVKICLEEQAHTQNSKEKGWRRYSGERRKRGRGEEREEREKVREEGGEGETRERR